MKHTAVVTFFLVAIFVLTQVVGLALLKAISGNLVVENGIARIAPDPATADMTPKTEGAASLLYIVIAVAVGTAVILLIVKFNKVNIWKAWFFLAVAVAVGISFKVILKDTLPAAGLIALLPWIIGGVFALLKILWRNPIFYNISEVLMYAGIALILAPIFNVLWAIILLVLISGYDMFAVWKSRHMVSMAQFQQRSTVFAGLMIPYKLKKDKTKSQDLPPPPAPKGANVTARLAASRTALNTTASDTEDKTAILGGGDVAFPLIFEGVAMRDLIIKGLSPNTAFLHAGIIVATTTAALALLFIFAKKDRFYPAMPFISAGCLAGWGMTLLL